MQYEIFGENLPAVTISLNTGESVYTQSGGMTWMTEGISMETNAKGGLMKGLSRMFSGESFFMATYTANRPSQITFASTFPGSILPLRLDGTKEYIAQKKAFLCAEPSVELSAEIVKGLAGGIFGGEGFVLQHLRGTGNVFLEMDGSIKEMDLGPSDVIVVDTGNVALYESTVNYSVETVKGFANIFFGGEGLFLTRLQGPGKVWLQTLSIPEFAKSLYPFMPKPTSHN